MAIKARAVPLWETTRDLSDSREFIGAMTVVATKTPAYHTILVGREIIWCACGTAATDGVFVYIDPDFWESLPNDYQRAFLLAHEVGHIVFAHMPRSRVFSLRGWLYKKLGINHWNPSMYNQAADYIINADLVACGLEAIESALLSPEYSRDDVTELVYIKLAEAEPEQPEQPDQPGEGSDTDPGEEAGDDAGDGSGDESGDQDGESGDDAADESGESGDESDESGESGDQGDEAGGDEAGDTAGDESATDGEPVPSDHGGHDQHLQPKYDGTEEEQEEAAAADIEDITRDIDTAIEQGELEGQRISDEMKSNSSRYKNDNAVDVLDTDWREELSFYFNRSARSGKSTWSKIHRRRYNLLGVVTPSKIGGLNRLAIIKDISYSVSDQSERVFDAKVAELLDQIDVASGTIVLHTNTKVMHVDEVYSGDEYLEVEKLDGGGTTMSAGTDWLAEEGESPDVTLVFTDGEMFPSDFEKIGETDAIMVIDSPANYVCCKYYLDKYGIECVVINDAA